MVTVVLGTEHSMHAHQKTLTKPDEIKALAATLSSNDLIALDTEFIRETTFFPIIALIQVATDTESWLVDPLAFKKEDLEPLLQVLSNPRITKVLHASQADQECLYVSYGIVATPSLDTAAAASLLGYGDSIGLAKLVREVLGRNIPKGHARTDWLARPIQGHLLNYAHQDVEHLIPLARKLIKALERKERKQWAFDLSARYEDGRLYEYNPDAIATKLGKSGKLDKRGFAVLRELVAWRERRVREANVPRRRIADDDVLVALAAAQPKDIEHTAAFRGLNKGELRHSGAAILTAIRNALAIPEADLRDVPKADIPDPHEARVIELVQVYVKSLADEHEIASRYLLSADDILRVLRGRYGSVQEMVSAGAVTAGAAALIGEDLLAMLHGKRLLSVQNSRLSIQKA